jgi:hypothetical protein
MKLKITYKKGKPYITGVSCSELARNKALAFFVKTLMPYYKCKEDNPTEKLVTPIFNSPSKTENTINISVINKPVDATIVWLVNDIIQVGENSTTLELTGLIHNTEYNISARYTQNGFITSDDALISITTDQSKLPTPLLSSPNITSNSIEITAINRPIGSTIIWIVDGVTQSETSNTLYLDSLIASTDYDITVQYTQNNYISSDITSTTITTEEEVISVIKRWYVNIMHDFGDLPSDSKWNNIRFANSTVSNNLLSSLEAGTITLIATTPFSGSENNLGAPSTALYENEIINSCWAFQTGDNSSIRIGNLDNDKEYNIYIGSFSINNSAQEVITDLNGVIQTKLNYQTWGANTDEEFGSTFFTKYLNISPVSGNIDIVFDCTNFFQNKLEAIVIEELGVATPGPEPDIEKAEINSLVDVAYWADESLNTEGELAQDGDEVQTIVDAKGNHNLPYNGTTTSFYGRNKMLGKGINWFNQSLTFFSKDIPQRPATEEYTIVFRQMPGQGWENIHAVFGTPYLGFGGGNTSSVGGATGIRVLDSDIWVDQNIELVYMNLCTMHVLVEPFNTTGTRATVWYNGILVGTVESNNSYRRSAFGIGSPTNCVEHIFYGYFYKSSKFTTDTDRQNYLDKVHSYFELGNIIDKPFAYNVRKVNLGGNNYRCDYDYYGVNPENTSAVEYMWVRRSGAAFIYNLVGTTKEVFYDGTELLICTVKVTDNQGNSWRFITEEGL